MLFWTFSNVADTDIPAKICDKDRSLVHRCIGCASCVWWVSTDLYYLIFQSCYDCSVMMSLKVTNCFGSNILVYIDSIWCSIKKGGQGISVSIRLLWNIVWLKTYPKGISIFANSEKNKTGSFYNFLASVFKNPYAVCNGSPVILSFTLMSLVCIV